MLRRRVCARGSVARWVRVGRSVGGGLQRAACSDISRSSRAVCRAGVLLSRAVRRVLTSAADEVVERRYRELELRALRCGGWRFDRRQPAGGVDGGCGCRGGGRLRGRFDRGDVQIELGQLWYRWALGLRACVRGRIHGRRALRSGSYARGCDWLRRRCGRRDRARWNAGCRRGRWRRAARRSGPEVGRHAPAHGSIDAARLWRWGGR